MNYWFGKVLNQEWKSEKSWEILSERKRSLYETSLEDIISCLDGFSSSWKSTTELYHNALPELVRESGFTEEEVRKTLDLLPSLLSRESLEKRVRAEFLHSNVLDKFTKLQGSLALVKAVPLGTVLHVTAGNVFLSSIDSLIMGLITKNISLLKTSSQNQFFPLYFAHALERFDRQKILSDKFAVLSWKGGDKETEAFLKAKVDAIVAWGGEEMIESYRQSLPPHVKFLDFGPKISLQLISLKGLQNKDLAVVGEKIVQDVLPWDQGACASPQNLYLEEGVDKTALIEAIDHAFRKAPPSQRSDDESVEILKEAYRGFYSELMEEGAIKTGPQHLLHLEKNAFVRPSPLNRSLIIKEYKDIDDLVAHISPFSYYLQSCSYLLSEDEKGNYLNALARTGLKRFAPLGTVTWGMEGAPHDGRFVLRELVNFIGDEARAQDYGEKTNIISNARTLKGHFDSTPHPNGYIFSSGGTTGEPKYIHFSYEEFDAMSDMLAANFRAQGLMPGMTVANLFVAGNLWSSFMAVEKALEKIGAIQLPIGGLCPPENILNYIEKFRPQVVMGIPSLLVVNAELGEMKGKQIEVEKIFYAGEPLSGARQDYLRKIWKTQYFGSAGYASVDAGVIGYQCLHCGPGEHHLFGDQVKMTIENDEALITSTVRTSLPIKNYATGDKVEWLDECACGRKDRRFKLLGRVDNLIQIWSCRVLLNDIESALRDLDSSILSYQVIVTEENVKEKMEIVFESKDANDSKKLLPLIYEKSRDLKDTISFEEFQKNAKATKLSPGEIKRNPRTGKISLIVDKRK